MEPIEPEVTKENIWSLVEEYIDEGNPNNLIPIGEWDVSQVTDMHALFYGHTDFNEPLNGWNVSNVTNMASMFKGCSFFNQPLDRWNVSNVRDMSNMFEFCASFNQSLISWNVSNVTNMRNMFAIAPRMEEQNKPSIENYNKYLQKQAREGAKTLADEVLSPHPGRPENLENIYIPRDAAAHIFKFLPIGNERNALIAAESGERQNIKRADILSKRIKPIGETAADASGGRTRRKRHGKKNSKKSRKSKKRRYSKRR
jgi:surface protein